MFRARRLPLVALDNQRRTLACVVIACATGWSGREHRALGTEAYRAACQRLVERKDRDPQTAQRYAIACSNIEVTSLLYGQGNSVGGDWVSEPNELLTASGASIVATKPNYWKLALTNSAHFHPLATREWRDFHKQAIQDALAASQMVGVDQLQGFEVAFAESAFGDHFLQDSFAAGHMGFNRPGSSASAAKAFHDEWGRRGRHITNRRGDAWFTYGDGRLDRPENRDARGHVLAACTESVYAVLVAFVLGERDPAPDFAVWQEVPYTIDDQELLPALESLFGGTETLERPGALPLLAVKRPAVKDGMVGVWSAYTMSFSSDDHDDTASIVAGGDLIIPWLGTRIEGGVGIAFDDGFRHFGFAGDASVVKPIGLSVEGLLSHEIDLGALVIIGSNVDVILRVGYRVNVEAGDWLLRPEVGPAYDPTANQWGFYAGFGIGQTTAAAGGGGFY